MTGFDVDSLLERLTRHGVHLSVHGDELTLRGPKAILDDELLEELRAHKPELLRRLNDHDEGSAAAVEEGDRLTRKAGHGDGEGSARKKAQHSDDPARAARHQPGFLARLLGVPDDDDG